MLSCGFDRHTYVSKSGKSLYTFLLLQLRSDVPGSAKLWFSDIPGLMFGRFVAAMAVGDFPLEMTCGT